MLMYNWSLPEMLRAPAKGLSGAQMSFSHGKTFCLRRVFIGDSFHLRALRNTDLCC